MTPRRIGLLLTLLVLVASGAYLLVYLYRWEWNRALVSGMFFIAAEVALVATSVLGRLESIERRLGQLAARTPSQPGAGHVAPPAADEPRGVAPLDRIREAAPERQPFAWLDPGDGRAGVFVPVLMGAGVVLSALAYLVERLAGATAGAAAERGLAGRLAVLSPPAVDLAAPPRSGTTAPGALLAAVSPRRLTAGERARRLVATAIVGLLAVTAVDVLADATQNRPDAIPRGLASTIDLEVEHRRGRRPVLLTAEALWVACRATLPTRIEATSITATGPRTARLVLEPAIGKHGRRRFQGCLEDATFDRVSASVVSLRTRPSAAAAAPTP